MLEWHSRLLQHSQCATQQQLALSPPKSAVAVHVCRGPGTAFEFALALVKALYGEEKMREVAGPMVMRDGWDAAL